ncbi:MAG: NrfD/PsrC family molybdoenzyme membrane anchor subunit [Akkermansiaceae bacterium]|jgi:Ni/Fe-hydrogenase subunit HybB-like protein
MTAHSLPNESLVNYTFPNEAEIPWSLMIVIYPYVTGLIAGAFVVSSLYHVFKVQAFARIARFALVVAFCFGVFAGLPLLVHLLQPQRAFNIFITPHFTAAMSIFGYVYASYMLLLAIEIWLVYRNFFVTRARETNKIRWRLLTLGVREYTPEAARFDRKIISVLAGLGIPAAFALHGYVGFIFGSIKANAWWATPLQPIIFLVSAIVSGIAMLILLYTFLMGKRGERCDEQMIRKLAGCLWLAFLLAFTFEMLEVGYAYYEHGHHWSVIGPLLKGPLHSSYVTCQIGIFSIPPILILALVTLVTMPRTLTLYLANLASLLLVTQVLFMRYNVVIGGQMISKSDRGFVDFHFELLGKEGGLMAAVILILPFIFYALLNRFMPILGGAHSESFDAD